MKPNEKKLLTFSAIFLGSIISLIMIGSSGAKPKKEITGNLIDAVVECQHKVKKAALPSKVDFDVAFKFKGTRELIKGVRFQVAGNIEHGKNKIKPYGCFVNYINHKYEVEAIL